MGVFSLHMALTEVTVIIRVLGSPSVFLPGNLSQHRFQRVAVENLGYTRRHHLTCTQKGRVSQRHVDDLLSVQPHDGSPAALCPGNLLEPSSLQCMMDAQSEQRVRSPPGGVLKHIVGPQNSYTTMFYNPLRIRLTLSQRSEL